MSQDLIGRLRVVINKPACCGYGVCAEICPDVYKLDENGIVFVEDRIIPEELEELATEGAEACPQSALAVERITEENVNEPEPGDETLNPVVSET